MSATASGKRLGAATAPGEADPPVRIGLIVAMDRKRAIGRDNALPWHLPDDLRRFKALTLGKPVLMGRRTAESLGRALPGRTNLVLTRGDRIPFAGMRAVASLDQAQAIAREEGAGELCVIGGAQVYALALPRATDLRMTHVETVVADADTFFPAYEAAEWTPVSRVRCEADAKHRFAFEFVDYVRAAPAVPR